MRLGDGRGPRRLELFLFFSFFFAFTLSILGAGLVDTE